MQPEVPTPQPQQPDPQVQSPVVQQAFQSTAPYPQPQAVAQALPSQPMLSANSVKKGHGQLITTIVLAILLIGATAFGIWAFASRADYKTNSDKKSAAAVEAALVVQKTTLDAEFVEKEKQPFDTYSGKAEAASIQITYPKTWSAYISEATTGSNPLAAFFHPGFVPNTQNSDVAYALRTEVVNTLYAQVLQQYQSNVSQGAVTLAPYSFPKVPTSLGSIISGKIVSGKEKLVGTIVVMPIRDKTLLVWTESNSAFGKDFNEVILPNLTFVP